MNFLEAINSLISPQAFVAGLSGTWSAEKVALTTRFLSRMIEEYEALKLEIEALKSEVKAPGQDKTQKA
jgi:hypothetical protein